mmetsp:Transcript_34232/g.56465  ORF Transcript_34232/g.56465 Transcript_34232/m.56465 type:complete len:259 (-) Transcript_34232:1251-2027(-)
MTSLFPEVPRCRSRHNCFSSGRSLLLKNFSSNSLRRSGCCVSSAKTGLIGAKGSEAAGATAGVVIAGNTAAATGGMRAGPSPPATGGGGGADAGAGGGPGAGSSCSCSSSAAPSCIPSSSTTSATSSGRPRAASQATSPEDGAACWCRWNSAHARPTSAATRAPCRAFRRRYRRQFGFSTRTARPPPPSTSCGIRGRKSGSSKIIFCSSDTIRTWASSGSSSSSSSSESDSEPESKSEPAWSRHLRARKTTLVLRVPG